MNPIGVQRTGVLAIELGPSRSAESLIVGDDEIAGWLASGKVRRDISQVGDVTQVRRSPVPLGEYPCSLAGALKGPLAVARARATSSYRL